MKNEQNPDGKALDKPRVVEIIGPAGAGKTTLYRALECRPEFIRLENFPDVRKTEEVPFYFSNCLRLMPSLLRLYRPSSRQLTRRELAWLAILNGWPEILRQQANDYNRAIILDQGPIYLLAEMRLFGPDYLRRTGAEGLWQDLYTRWMATLHMIVWLDAADDVLLHRIRTRRQEHSVKTEPATVAYDFLDRYRAEYESIVSNLTANMGSLKVLRFDTGLQQPHDIVSQFLSELDGQRVPQ